MRNKQTTDASKRNHAIAVSVAEIQNVGIINMKAIVNVPKNMAKRRRRDNPNNTS